MSRLLLSLLLVAGHSACSDGGTGLYEDDLGPIEDVLDDITRTVWPGLVDGEGQRAIRRLNGFFDDTPTAYWFSGFAPRFTADVLWFCRAHDSSCPFDTQGNLAPQLSVGGPVFSRMPGEAGYSPYWRVQVVRVSDDYRADDLKSVFGVEAAQERGLVSVAPLLLDRGGGAREVIVHCLLVLEGTTLEKNGADMVGQPGVQSRVVAMHAGWHKQHRVRFFDFVATEGAFAPDPERVKTSMPFADIFVLFRDCQSGSAAPLCSLTSAALVPVTERGVEADLTGDGDKSDTNNIVAAVPNVEPSDPSDRPYSALWKVHVVPVVASQDSNVRLIDSSADQASSDVTSVQSMRERVQSGLLRAPEPMSEAQAGNSIVGNEGEVFFNCPSQVAP